jgi:hypothetical protein
MVTFFGIESKSERGFEKGDMHIVITIELMTIVSLITIFELKLVSMFFHMDSIREFLIFLQSWSFVTIAIIIVDVRGGGNNKGEKQLLIENGEGEFDQDVIGFGNNFRT